MDHYEEYLKAGVMPKNLEPCPERIAGDVDRCKFNEGRVCELETYKGECKIYQEWLEEK